MNERAQVPGRQSFPSARSGVCGESWVDEGRLRVDEPRGKDLLKDEP